MLKEKLAVRQTLDLEAPKARAFEVFARQMGAWWPPAFSINGSPIKAVVIEPTPGGRWYEEGEDGSQADWGKVVAFEPSDRVVLTWQISASYAFDPETVTTVDVRFSEAPSGGCRVEFEHRDLEAYGENAEGMHAMLSSPQGWPAALDLFAKSAGLKS